MLLAKVWWFIIFYCKLLLHNYCAFITLALDHTHRSSVTRAWHEVSCPYAQPHQGQLWQMWQPSMFFLLLSDLKLNTLPFFLRTEQCSAQSTCYHRSGCHRTSVIPLTRKTGTGPATGRPQSSVGRWQRACWRLLPCCSATLKDLRPFEFWLLCGINRSGLWYCGDIPERVRHACTSLLYSYFLYS